MEIWNNTEKYLNLLKEKLEKAINDLSNDFRRVDNILLDE